MKRTSMCSVLRDSLTALSGLAMLCSAAFSTGCGAEGYEDVETTELPISGGWVTLNLINGWTNYNTGNAPAVGIVNGVVTFRGAIKATNPTSNVPFRLSDATYGNYQPFPAARVLLRTVMRTSGGTNVGGMFDFNPLDGTLRDVKLFQDNVSPVGHGSAARNFTSLDGVSFDRSSGEPVTVDYLNDWDGVYGHRLGESGCSHCGLFVKLVDGFVRFQGRIDSQTDDFNGFVGTLPSSTFIPGQSVMVPINLGQPVTPSTADSWGSLTINPDGSLFVNGNPIASDEATSFEGVWFSKTNNGNINLPLNTAAGWGPYSPRTVKVGKYGDVVRFQGAISGGNSTTIATLPAGYRPPVTVRLVGVANGLPVTINITTSGVMTFQDAPLSVASTFLSLDGVSFGL